jgi:hypothetical protein
MFLIATAHLSLLIQEAMIGKVLRPVGQAAGSLSLAQVCEHLFNPFHSAQPNLRFLSLLSVISY